MDFAAGNYKLSFADSGKLKNLFFGDVSILKQTDYTVDLGDNSFGIEGWDECFPTIAKFSNYPRLGHLVRMAPEIIETPGYFEQVWHTEQYTARRHFELNAAADLVMTFIVKNISSEPMQYLWASHAIFDSYNLLELQFAHGGKFRDFNRNNTCSKFFVEAVEPIKLVRKDILVQIKTDQPYWGIWLNRGGWPLAKPAGICCVAVEATNRPAETPGNDQLDPGSTFQGNVTLSVLNSKEYL